MNLKNSEPFHGLLISSPTGQAKQKTMLLNEQKNKY